jgi:hypothetical protein
MHGLLAAFAIAVLAIAASPAATADTVGISVVFSSEEAATIRAYYREHVNVGGGKARGNKGNKGLPPGIARNLAAGKPLPPGIAKRGLPSGLISQLPPAPRGYERIELAGKILLVEIATQVIHDVIEDLVFD